MLQFLKVSCKTCRTTDSNTSDCCSRITASGVNRNISQFSKLGKGDSSLCAFNTWIVRRKGREKDICLSECGKLHSHPAACKNVTLTAADVLYLHLPGSCRVGVVVFLFFSLPLLLY